MLSHHPNKFGGYRRCGSGDINISAKTSIFTQMRDVRRWLLYPLTSAINFSKVRHVTLSQT